MRVSVVAYWLRQRYNIYVQWIGKWQHSCGLMFLLIGAFVGAYGRLAVAQETPAVVAVLGLKNQGAPLQQSVVDSMSAYLTTELVSTGAGRYTAVPRDEVKQALSQKKRESYEDCYAESCQIEIGQEVAANKVLSGRILKIGAQCFVTLNLFDLRKAAQEKGATGEGACSEDGVRRSMDAALAELISGRQTTEASSSSDAPAFTAPDFTEAGAELREILERRPTAAEEGWSLRTYLVIAVGVAVIILVIVIAASVL